MEKVKRGSSRERSSGTPGNKELAELGLKAPEQRSKESEVELLKLKCEAMKLENEKLSLQVRKLELEALAASREGVTKNVQASMGAIGGSDAVFSSKNVSLTSLGGVHIKKEFPVGEKAEKMSDVASSESEGEGEGWTPVSVKKKRKGFSVHTSGEQSDWERTKFMLRTPMDSLGVTRWVGKLRTHRKSWSVRDYKQARKNYKERDIEWYKLLVESASSETKGKDKKVKESTMSKAARNKDKEGVIPWGHGGMLYLHYEDLFENVQQTDPNYADSKCEVFREAEMKKNQSPTDWLEHLRSLRNECAGKISESEFVNRFVMKSTSPYERVKETFSLLSQGKIWDITEAYTNMNRYYNLMVRHNSSSTKEEKKNKKQKERDEKAAVQQELFVAAASLYCDWCGKPGHFAKECTEQNPQRWCSYCKSDSHWPHRCFDLKGKGGGRGRGKGGRKQQKGSKGRGKGSHGKGKGKSDKGKRYQQQHFEFEESSHRSSSKDDSDDVNDYEYDGWKMNVMEFDDAACVSGDGKRIISGSQFVDKCVGTSVGVAGVTVEEDLRRAFLDDVCHAPVGTPNVRPTLKNVPAGPRLNVAVEEGSRRAFLDDACHAPVGAPNDRPTLKNVPAGPRLNVMDCVGEQCVVGVSSKADGVCEKCTESPALLEMNEGSKVVFLHDSGCTHHAVDEQSILASLVHDFEPNRGSEVC